MDVLVERVPAPETFTLRQRVLRPHQRVDEMAMAGDDDPSTGLFAAKDPATGEVVSTASVRREPPPWIAGAPSAGHYPPVDAPPAATRAAGPGGEHAWRLRGMATAEDRRGQGLGKLVLDAALAHVAAEGGGLLWCSARTGARRFYEREGLVALGKVFEVPVIGPHVLMWKVVPA
jgi:GNAT superfamily N-acetyltransferase